MAYDRISARARRIPQSEIRRIFNLALTMKDVIHLEIGEPDFPTPDHILDAACAAGREGWTKYPPSLGDPELLRALGDKLLRQNGIAADPAGEILVTNGGSSALASTMMALLDDGDEVIVPDPGWSPYCGEVLMAGGRPVFARVREEDGFAADPEIIRDAITPRTKAVVVNSPSNPTGGVTARENMLKIAEMCASSGVWMVSDEVYENLVYEGEHFSPASVPELRNTIVTVNSFSKTYSMTGWRVGYVAAPKPLLNAIMKMQEQYIASPSSISQRAALAALRGPQECVETMAGAYHKRRDLIVAGLNAIQGFSCKAPSGSFYAFANIQGFGIPSMDFAMKLLEEARVATVPGASFGPHGEGFLRISFASSEQNLKEALERIADAVKSGRLGSKS